MIYDVFSVPFLWFHLLGSLEQWVGHEYSGLDSALTCWKHTLMRLVSLPSEDGLPGCRRNTNPLKYLNVRSLRRLSCNYTCPYHIPSNVGVIVPAWTEKSANNHALMHLLELLYAVWKCVCCGKCVLCLWWGFLVFVFTAAVCWTPSWNTLICSPLPAAQINTNIVKM